MGVWSVFHLFCPCDRLACLTWVPYPLHRCGHHYDSIEQLQYTCMLMSPSDENAPLICHVNWTPRFHPLRLCDLVMCEIETFNDYLETVSMVTLEVVELVYHWSSANDIQERGVQKLNGFFSWKAAAIKTCFYGIKKRSKNLNLSLNHWCYQHCEGQSRLLSCESCSHRGENKSLPGNLEYSLSFAFPPNTASWPIHSACAPHGAGLWIVMMPAGLSGTQTLNTITPDMWIYTLGRHQVTRRPHVRAMLPGSCRDVYVQTQHTDHTAESMPVQCSCS